MEIINYQSISTYRVITFDELFMHWLFTKKKDDLKTRTIERYLCNYYNYIKNALGYYDVKKINTIIIANFLESLKTMKTKRHDGLSSASISNIRANLHSCFEYAIYYEIITTNPVKFTKQRKEKTNNVDIFTKEERLKIENYLLNNFNITTIGFYILFYTGMRIGELAGLKWKNVNLDERIITIKESLNIKKNIETNHWIYFDDTPKTNNSCRFIPIPNHLIEIFKRIKKLNINSEYVISKTNGEVLKPRAYRPLFLKILNELNIRKIKIHAIRHTFATNMIENGMNINTLSLILGHSSIKVTVNTYLHSSLDKKIKSVNQIPFIYEKGELNEI